jgi:hypothetical protein
MNFVGESEYSALIDMLKNITDVVSELTIKINLQEDEINKLKEIMLNNKNNSFKTNNYNSQAEQYKAEQDKEEQIKTTEYTQDITTIGETEIENIKKKKLIQVVDNLIQQKKTIENTTNNFTNKNNEDEDEDKEDKEDKKPIQKMPIRKKTIFSRRF